MSLGDTLHSSISREKIQQTVRFGVLGWGCGFFGMVVFFGFFSFFVLLFVGFFVIVVVVFKQRLLLCSLGA